MKSAKIVLLCLALLCIAVSAVAEGVVVRAATPVDFAAIEHYPSYRIDAATGKWSVNANHADALVDAFWKNATSELCVFHVAVEGNANTGVITPVLRFYYAKGRAPINASAVSLLVDGVRFDLAASSSAVERDGKTAELITAPLTSEALNALQTVFRGRDVSIRLMGDNVYTLALDPSANAARRQVESASLKGLDAAVKLLDAIGMGSYQLWDLSAAAWKSEYGYTPAFAQSEVSPTLREVKVDDPFGMVLYNNRTSAATAAQEVLIQYGFLAGAPATSFDEVAVSAARRAQHYLGMIETGAMDTQLAKALEAGRRTVAKEEVQLSELASVAQVGLRRYWFADGVAPSGSAGAARKVYNSDNVFLVAEGMIRNVSESEQHLFMQMKARLLCNAVYVYEATIACEINQGKTLDSVLLPMSQARLLVYAEIPAELMNDPEAIWTIELTSNGESVTFDLQ